MQDTAARDERHRWLQDLDPLMRPHVLNKIVMKLAQIYHGQLDSTEDLNSVAARFENKVFHEANSKEDYLRRISLKLVTLEQKQKEKQLQRVASVHQQQIQTGSHAQPFNAVHAFHGANSSIAAMSQAEPMMSSQGRQSSHEKSLPPMTHLGSGQVPNQHMAFPFAPNMHFNVKHEQLEVSGKPHQALQTMQPINFSGYNPITPSAAGVQLSQQIVHSVATQNPQHLAFQMQPINFLTYNSKSMAHPQGQPLVQPTVQQNHLLRQNAGETGMLPQEQVMVNQQGFGLNQQQMMDRQNYQTMALQQANATNMHNGHPGGQSSQAGARVGLQSTLKIHELEALNEYINMQPQPMAQPQQLITVSQQNSLFSTTGSAGDVDWREEMFQQIKPLKDAYLSELMELDQVVLVPKITQEQFESLPKDKADKHRFKVNLKRKMAVMLKFLLLEKNDIPDNFRGKLSMFLKSIQDLLASYKRSKDRMVDARCKSQIHHGQHQITNLSGDQFPSSGSASHQNQPEQPVRTQLRENTIGTVPAGRQVIISHLLGVASSCFPENSQRSLGSSPTNKFQECSMMTPSPVIKSGTVNVSSPSASLKSPSPSAITAPGATKAAASSSVSVMSALPSPVAMPGDVNVASPCASANSMVPSAITDSASIQAASPCSSAKSTLLSPSAMSGVIEAAPVTNSGCAAVALPYPSVQPISSENDVIFSDLLLQDNSAAAASAQVVVGETATQAEKDCREVAAIKPIIPASPHQAETAGHPAEYNKHPGNELPVAKKPIDRLLDAVRASSPAMLSSAANCVYSVLNSNDWAPHRETDEFENWTFFSEQGGSNTPNKMKRDFDTTSVLSESTPPGTASEAENNAEHGAKRPKTKDAKDTLLDEINSVNSMLLDTLISIIDDNGTDGITSSNGETLIKFSYTATSLAPDLASLFATSGMSIIMPVKLLVQKDYPSSSPVIVSDKGDEEMRKSLCDISGEVDSAFQHTLRGLPEPMSVADMARAWDASVRRAVVEFAKQHGGGTISSSNGEWASADGA